ncbi:unnamed protein product [Malus baccata var. baccata]
MRSYGPPPYRLLPECIRVGYKPLTHNADVAERTESLANRAAFDDIKRHLLSLESSRPRDNIEVSVTRMGFLNTLENPITIIIETLQRAGVTDAEMSSMVQSRGVRTEMRAPLSSPKRLNFDLSGSSHVHSDDRLRSQIEDSLLSTNLVWEALHGKFTQLLIKYFKGNPDPSSHIMSYKNAMALYSNNDPLKCKIFPSTIKRSSMKWYVGLPPGSILNF